jgi:endonuclease VIII
MRTDAGLTVHSHLRMSGRWSVLGPGRRLPRAVAARLRIALGLDDGRTLAGIDLPVLTVVRTRDEGRVVGHLGPDLLAPADDLARAAANVVAAGPVPVVAALLDQRRVAGLGNMWAQELLFLHGLDPWRPAGGVDPLPLLADGRARLRHAVDHDPAQSTTGRRTPRHWVYGRYRRPCLRCTTPVAFRAADATAHGRETWWCPGCQR